MSLWKIQNRNFLDCLLSGKITGAGGYTTLSIKERFCEGTRLSYESSLRCCIQRFKDGTQFKFENIEPIHLKSALRATRALIDCMSDSDAKLYLRFSFDNLMSYFRNLSEIPYLQFIKCLKYYTAYPLAFFLKNELPEKPEGVPLGNYPFPCNNKIRTWWKERLFSTKHYKRNLQLFWSLLQGVKRSCEFAGSEFIHTTMEKHKATLSKTHELDFSEKDLKWEYGIDTGNDKGPKSDEDNSEDLSPEEERENFDTYIKQGFKKEVESFFENFRPYLNTKYEISNSACWEYKRSQGGARSYILDRCNDVYHPMYRIAIQAPCATVLHGMINDRGRIIEMRGVRTPDLIELIYDSPVAPLNAQVAAILEPLKVRLITKGPAEPYFVAKCLQKQLFAYLQRFPQFELTGDPLREDHIYRMIEREKLIDMVGDKFVSGDYSAATDNLRSWFTKTAFRASMQNFQHEILGSYKVMASVIGSHMISYPEITGFTQIESFFQWNGQLMGSPLSFPFLCIANLICYKLSLEWCYGESELYDFKNLPCLVNGDDILFRTNDEHYKVWKDIVKLVGFDLSIGKNYVHEKVLTINSTMFVHDKKTNKLTKIDYCNFGLLSGTSKLGGSRGERREKAVDLADSYTRSVGGAENKPLMHALFLQRNRELISKVTRKGRYNLFLPTQVGGIGLPLYEGINNRLTRFQLLLREKILRSATPSLEIGFISDNLSFNTYKYDKSPRNPSIHFGFGPLNEHQNEQDSGEISFTNIAYQLDGETRFVVKIPEKYKPEEVFPFRLSDNMEFLYDRPYFLENRKIK